MRIRSDDELRSFNWKAVTCELKQRAPTFLAVCKRQQSHLDKEHHNNHYAEGKTKHQNW